MKSNYISSGIRLVPGIIFLFLISCHQNKKALDQKAEVSTKLEFISEAPVKAGLDPVILDSMTAAIEGDIYPNIHSVLISIDNKLVYENYFEGEDELWGEKLGVKEHHKDSLHDVRSVSKSVVATCVGIAIEQGKISGVDQSIFDFFPEYSDYNVGKRSELTIKHLLNMSSGMKWNENVPYTDPENSEIQMTSSEDPIEFVLSREIINPPGQVWEYNGGTTQLLAAIIEKVSGLNIHQFARKHLFTPLGIEDSEWIFYPKTDLPAAASGLRLRSRDMLKLGMLYSNKGTWNNTQVLAADWISESTTAHIRFGRNNVGYGYQFWILSAGSILENQSHEIAAAFGNGGQRIYLDDKHDLLVVITAGNYNQWTIKKDSEALLVDFIYPALASD